DAVRLLAVEGRRLSHVVFMGMGEPMANYRAVVESVRRLSDPDLLAISPRRIVVSTSGLIPSIDKLGREKITVTITRLVPAPAVRAPGAASLSSFKSLVDARSLNVTGRDTRGREADAACWQLHERVMRNKLVPVS